MRTKVLTNRFACQTFPCGRTFRHYVPSNLEHLSVADGVPFKATIDIVGYNSQFNAKDFSLQTMRDSGIDISQVKGVQSLPYSSFKVINILTSSDHE